MPFSPVPVTGQTLAVLTLAMLLGSARGAACVAAYLAQGLAGFPVFAAGLGGFAHLLGPTGGYLLGFAFGAYVAGRLAERGWSRTLGRSAAALSAGTAVIFAVGYGWLALFVGPAQALALGVAPFLTGAGLKIAAGSAVVRGVSGALSRRR